MRIKPFVICIISVIMMIALAAHAPTVPQVSQAVEGKDNISNQTELLLSGQTGSFNLFTLSGPEEAQSSVRRPTTLIPDRPAVRSPFQPSWR